MATNDYVYLKNVNGQIIKPVTDLSAINMTTTNGIAVDASNGGTIGIRSGYIENCVVTELSQPDQQATPEEAYIDGGTMYTLLGGYEISDEVPSQNASPYRVPSEVAVRAAIDAYVATGGSDIVPGNGITVSGGSIAVAAGNGINADSYLSGGVSVKAKTNGGISVTAEGVGLVNATNNTLGGIAGATNGVTIVDGVAQFDVTSVPKKGDSTNGVIVDVSDGLLVSGGTAKIDVATVEEVLTDNYANPGIDDVVVTPDNLRGALSVAQAVDVSCPPYHNTGTIVYTNDDYLQGFTASMVAGTTVGFYNNGDEKFPKFAKDGSNNPLHYIFIADVSGTGTITPNGQSAVVLSSTPQRISMEITAEDTGFFSAEAAATVNVTNWRQYEVNALTADAKEYLSNAETNPNPDSLFRSTSVYSVLNKYLIKQDMVSPWIPIIDMKSSPAVTIGAGLAYKLVANDDEIHTLMVDTFPDGAYGQDSKLSVFVGNTGKILIQSPLILMQPFTANAVNNCTIKFRDGEARMYVDDTAYGYTVTINAGTVSGSLHYGLSNSTTNYITFSAVTDGTPITDTGLNGLNRDVNLIGNGAENTVVSGGTISKTVSNTTRLLTMQGMTFDDVSFSEYIWLNNLKGTSAKDCVFNNCHKAPSIGGGESEFMMVSQLSGCTFSNFTVPNNWGRGITMYTANGGSPIMENCVIKDSTISTNMIFNYGPGSANYTRTYKNCLFKDIIQVPDVFPVFFYSYGGNTTSNSHALITGTTFSNCGRDTAHTTAGIGFSTGQGHPVLYFEDCVLDTTDIRLTGSTDSHGKLYFYNENTLKDCKIYGGGDIILTANSTLKSADNTGVIVRNSLYTQIGISGLSDQPSTDTLDGIEIRGCTNGSGVFEIARNVGVTLHIKNCYIHDNYSGSNSGANTLYNSDGTFSLIIEGSTISGTGTSDNINIGNCAGCTITGSTLSQGLQFWGAEAYRPIVLIKDSTLGVLRDDSANYTFSVGGNSKIASCKFGKSELRLEAGSTLDITGTTMSTQRIIIGAYNAAGEVFTVGGTATVVYTGGSTVLSGIGTYVTTGGANDFSTPTHVTTNETTGTGSLDAALTAGKYAVVDAGVTGVVSYDNATTVSEKYITDAAGDLIIGGTWRTNGFSVSNDTRTATLTGNLGWADLVAAGFNMQGWKRSTLDMNRHCFSFYNSNVHPRFENLTLTNGYAIDHGGFAYFLGETATFVNCDFVNNTAAAWGGALCIRSSSTVSLTGCNFSGNIASTAAVGNAIRCDQTGTVSISGCSFGLNQTIALLTNSDNAGRATLSGTNYIYSISGDGGPLTIANNASTYLYDADTVALTTSAGVIIGSSAKFYYVNTSHNYVTGTISNITVNSIKKNGEVTIADTTISAGTTASIQNMTLVSGGGTTYAPEAYINGNGTLEITGSTVTGGSKYFNFVTGTLSITSSVLAGCIIGSAGGTLTNCTIVDGVQDRRGTIRLAGITKFTDFGQIYSNQNGVGNVLLLNGSTVDITGKSVDTNAVIYMSDGTNTGTISVEENGTATILYKSGTSVLTKTVSGSGTYILNNGNTNIQ